MALESVVGKDNIDDIRVSGMELTFTLKKGAEVSAATLQGKLPGALKENGVTFEGLSMSRKARAKAAFVLKTPGLT